MVLVASVLLAGSAPGPSRAEQVQGDRLYLYSPGGLLQGTISPSAPFVAQIWRDGVRKNSVAGTSTPTGAYSTAIGYSDGVGFGVHNGDTIEVTDRSTGQTYSQVVQLGGVLDERTGTFIATVRPNAAVSMKLSPVYDQAHPVVALEQVADDAGRVRVEFGALHTPPAPATDRPAWRGYIVNIESRDVSGQAQYRTIQTPGVTLAWTFNQAGGGHFSPGDTVVQELWNGGTKRSSISSTVNADGIPRGVFPVDVIDGDVFRTRFHDTSGTEQSIDLVPWNLTATVDGTTRTVRGRTEPFAPLTGFVSNGAAPEARKTRAAADGTFELTYDVMEPGVMLILSRGADTGYTGIGTQALTIFTPVVQINDVTGDVSGYGSAGVTTAVARLERGGSAVSSASAKTLRTGKFTLKVASEMVAGDRLSVSTGSQSLPAAEIGAFSAHRNDLSSTAPFSGTAAAGGRIAVQSSDCSVTATAGASGWNAPGGCGFAPAEVVQVTYGPAAASYAGWSVGRFEWVTSPDITLSAPAPSARVTGPVTISASAFDHDDAAAPAEVQFVVDGKIVAVDTSAPYSAAVTMTPGSHRVWAVAIDSARRKDATGATIYGTTAARRITVS